MSLTSELQRHRGLIVDPPYQKTYDWEKIDFINWQEWMESHWSVGFTLCGVYLLLTFVGKTFVSHRKPFDLRTPLILWNTSLAAFSALAFYRLFPGFHHILTQPNGFYLSTCTTDMASGWNLISEHFTLTGCYWRWVVTLSKVVEFGDTAFIILRKRPLIFLHWFHHATAMMLAWTGTNTDPVFMWTLNINMFIHTIMYTYYAATAAGYKPPRKFAVTITAVQVAQMALVLFINGYSTWAKYNGWECVRSPQRIFVHTALYGIYFILFSRFFVQAYLRKPKAKRE